MDIKNNLKEAIENRDAVEKIIKSILDEQAQLEKKLHIFKVISLADKIEQAIETGYFNEPKVEALTFVLDYNDFIYLEIGYYLTNDDQTLFSENDNKIYYEKPISFFTDLFKEMGKFKAELTSENHEPDELKLEIGIKDKILDILLSDELKKILEYNKMQLELPTNKNNTKKSKM
jgi:hypothetical protein